ncbi:hypothetical protein SAMN04487905_108123 [Actinopolyspora xinjiangensis]|uniref:Uncharacterized protein n=1 Tax=Actinopolyspora xinjiangensis TaxID=405564 RepID=A0A1H0VAD1_9ACTN|nr:hypothetical protein [Actinopolyspora xinjiangensis]SDP75331.1 hypothetical protein SAMN04487905_108123 [Actinopolyspora xinjiangensis]
MSGGEQWSTVDRQRRWLSRALVVVGGTVAGISAAWLFGSASAVASAEHSEGGTLRQVGALIRPVGEGSGDAVPGDAEHDGAARSSVTGRSSDTGTAAEPADGASGPVSTLSRALGTDGTARKTTVDSKASGDDEDSGSRTTERSDASVSGGSAPENDSNEGPVRTVLESGGLAGTTDRLSGSVSDGLRDVRRGVDPLLRPVERVAGTVVSGATGEDSLSGAVESGLGGLRDSLRETVSASGRETGAGESGSTGIPGEPLTRPAGTRLAPPQVEITSQDSTARDADADSRTTSVFTVSERSRTWLGEESRHERDGSPSKTPGGKPPFPSGDCGCATDTTTSGSGSHNGYGLGDSLPASRGAVPSLGAITRANVYDPADSEGPQPGTTPD